MVRLRCLLQLLDLDVSRGGALRQLLDRRLLLCYSPLRGLRSLGGSCLILCI